MPKLDEILKKPQVKNVIVVIVVLLLSLQVIKFVKKLWDKNASLSSQIKKDQAELSHGTNISSTQVAVSKEITKLESDINEVQNNFFTNPEAVFAEVNRFAQGSHMSIKSITPSDRKKVAIPDSTDIYIDLFSITLRASCDYNQLIGFLKKIGASDKFITIDKITVQSNMQDIWNHNIELELKVALLVNLKKNNDENK